MSEGTEDLIARALSGDEASWRTLVERHSGLVWSIIRSLDIAEPDDADVFQTVFLRLTENLGQIRAVTLPAWLVTVTRRACYDVARSRQRHPVPIEDPASHGGATPGGPEEDAELEDEERAVLAGLFRLSDRCQRLLRLLSSSAEMSYSQIAELLDLPIGSIGPTRARCLDALRATPEVNALDLTIERGLV